MSRLDSFIRRMSAQRDLLDAAAALAADVPGPVIDLGLGAGRTYDHLRMLFPERPVFAFGLELDAALGVLPDHRHLVIGDIRETLAHARKRLGGAAALLHNDLGSGDGTLNAATAAWLSPLVAAACAPGAVVVTSFPLDLPGSRRLALPRTVAPGRYHLYRLARAGVR